MTKKEIYENNQRKAKLFSVVAPFVFWALLLAGIVLILVALKNSAGNMGEITTLLNSKKYTGEELRANYIYLTEKYGEWIIGNGNGGFQIMFVDVRNAVFSGVAIASGIIGIVLIVLAFVLGKKLLPKLSERLTRQNQDMVNLTILDEK